MRLIDADALFKDICDSINEMTKIGIMVDGEWLWAKLNDALENAPTIEPEPEKGKWIWSDEDASWKCGKCDCVFEEIDWKPEYNFCPNCGARLEEAE